ncbi:MAG: GMC family oxidoreductase N-terminal domain-containing protein [Ignavibacteriae bacterium]|nr:GMC family oxidoreductase N-terminal domain-containing protein [Ignavibacteriota bacterium]
MADTDLFDYIVIGSGASGAVVANRLSAAAGNHVLLLEAGVPDSAADIKDPGGFVRLWGSEIDWTLGTESQPALADRAITINQGKVLGGSTSINAMMYVRGNRGNFDQWNMMGADGWGYDDVLPYFKKSEDFEDGPSKYHGAGGPLRIRVCPDNDMRSDAFMNAGVEVGFDGPHWDYNGARQEHGAGLLQFHINDDGTRASTATAFLDPVRSRTNLTITTGAEATRLLIENGRAVAVEYSKDGATQTARAAREIVVSAGAFLSPKLLLLSGIGPADELRALGIPVVADLPGVGKNLQDHMQLPVIFRSKVDTPRTTLLTGNVLFVKTREGMTAAVPDLQLNFTPAIPKPLAPILPDLGGPVAIFLPILVQPFSIGSVSLRSSNPFDKPVINPNYLQRDADVEVFRKAVALIRDMANSKAFAGVNGGELAPGDGDLDGYIRTQSSTLWHPAGTCKIGRDAMAVVDPRLRVYGVAGLRVADASVMPTVPSGNTVAGCFMIGEKAADMILHDNTN